MNDNTAQELFDFISRNLELSPAFLGPSSSASIDVTMLLDKIAELRGMDKEVNGAQFNEHMVKREEEAHDLSN